MDASVSIHMLLDPQPMAASQYDAACYGAVSSGTIVTLDGVPGVVEYAGPGIATYTPVVQYAASAAAAATGTCVSTAAVPLNNGASNANSINSQIAVPSQQPQQPPPQQTAYFAAVTDPGGGAPYYEPNVHYVLPVTTCDSSPVHQGDSYAPIVAAATSSTVATTAESYAHKSIQGKHDVFTS